tara:strand:- start:529 stop:870 length:342 start_codon:yes stop_codon:yes gene_type:complete
MVDKHVNQDIQDKLEQHRAAKAEQKSAEKQSESIKFSDEEIKKIESIKANYDGLTLRMGQLHFEIQSLTNERENVEKLFQENRSDEVKFAQDLTTKYGRGSLDIETGIFTPSA